MVLEQQPLREQDFWRERAACATSSTTMIGMLNAWVDEFDQNHKYAKMICEACPVRNACVLDAVADPYADGLRGGWWFTVGGVDRAAAREIAREFGLRVRLKKSHSHVPRTAVVRVNPADVQ